MLVVELGHRCHQHDHNDCLQQHYQLRELPQRGQLARRCLRDIGADARRGAHRHLSGVERAHRRAHSRVQAERLGGRHGVRGQLNRWLVDGVVIVVVGLVVVDSDGHFVVEGDRRRGALDRRQEVQLPALAELRGALA